MTSVCIGALTRDVSCLEEKEKRFCGTAGPPFWLNRNKILDVVLHASASSRASVQIGKRPSAAAYSRRAQLPSRRAQLPSRRTLGGLSDRVRHRGNITVLRRTKEMFTPHGRVKSSDAFRVRRLNRPVCGTTTRKAGSGERRASVAKSSPRPLDCYDLQCCSDVAE